MELSLLYKLYVFLIITNILKIILIASQGKIRIFLRYNFFTNYKINICAQKIKKKIDTICRSHKVNSHYNLNALIKKSLLLK